MTNTAIGEKAHTDVTAAQIDGYGTGDSLQRNGDLP
jgi:hypothetical protein